MQTNLQTNLANQRPRKNRGLLSYWRKFDHVNANKLAATGETLTSRCIATCIQNPVNWGMVSFGNAELMLGMHGKPGPHDVSLWFYTDQIDRLYQLLKSRQLEAAQAALAGKARRS